MVLEMLELPVKSNSSHYAGQYVRDRHAEPYSIYTPYHGQEYQTRGEDKDLPVEWQENGFPCHADALEEVGSNHLKADDGESHDDDSQSVASRLY